MGNWRAVCFVEKGEVLLVDLHDGMCCGNGSFDGNLICFGELLQLELHFGNNIRDHKVSFGFGNDFFNTHTWSAFKQMELAVFDFQYS